MKINRLEAHDRLEYLKKDQSLNIAQGAEDCLRKNSLSLALQEKSPYIYIFAHPRTADDGVNKVMYWQPRLGKPEPQTNSYLFRAQSKTDNLEVCWMIPPTEMWKQYQVGNVTQHDIVLWSIDQFINNKKGLSAAEKDDLPEHIAQNIYRGIISEKLQDIKMKKMFPTPKTLEDFEALP